MPKDVSRRPINQKTESYDKLCDNMRQNYPFYAPVMDSIECPNDYVHHPTTSRTPREHAIPISTHSMRILLSIKNKNRIFIDTSLIVDTSFQELNPLLCYPN